MRRLLLLFLFSAVAFSYVIEYSGSVDVYYRCSPYVTEFGICYGDCFGFFVAIGDTPEKPPVRVYVGDVNAEVNYTKYQVDDYYQPNLWVVQFRAHGKGPVRVETRLRVEAYLLINFGVGKPMYLKAITLPYFAGRRETTPWEIKLGSEGDIVVCTVGKYAGRGEILQQDIWRPASVSTGWYSSVVSGRGSGVRLYWSNTPESAIKVAYIFLMAPKGPDKAYVVGLDGLLVPAEYLRVMAGPGVVVDKDGLVSFFGNGYLKYGNKTVELRPNATVVVEGRHCRFVGQTSGGEPLKVSVLFGEREVTTGAGRVDAFCIPGVTRARYVYVKQYPITTVSYTAEADGNYTLPLVKTEFVVYGVFRTPQERYEVEAPPGYPLHVHLKKYNYSEVVQAIQGVKDVYPYHLLYHWDLILVVPMLFGVVAAAVRRRTDLLFNMSLLAAVFTVIYFLLIQLAGLKPSTLVGYLAFVAAAMAGVAVALSGDVLVAVFYTAALSALVYTLVVSLGLSEVLILALAALATVAIRGGEVLAVSAHALNLQRCSCKTNLKDAKNQAYKKVEPIINAGSQAADRYIRELARLCKIRTFGRSTAALALCMANGGVISWRLYSAVMSKRQEEIAEALRGEVV